jgi:hypothetical protein
MSTSNSPSYINIATAFDRCSTHGVYVPVHTFAVDPTVSPALALSLAHLVLSATHISGYSPNSRRTMHQQMRVSTNCQARSTDTRLSSTAKQEWITASQTAEKVASETAFEHVKSELSRLLSENDMSGCSIGIYAPTDPAEAAELATNLTAAKGMLACGDSCLTLNDVTL